MNKYIEILRAIDASRITGSNVLEIPRSFLDEELEEVLNISTGSALGNRKGRLGMFEILVYPDVRVSKNELRQDA